MSKRVAQGMAERLTAAAIKRDGNVLERGFKSHYQLRAALDPDDPDPRETKPGDVDGFVTTAGRFVDRDQAKSVALAAGQISKHWERASRPLLSSDINW
jgi:hypothetical protein